ELPVTTIPRQDRIGLALRVHVPAKRTVDTFVKGHFALHREAAAAAARRVVALNARVGPLGGLAGEVDGLRIGLQIRARQVATCWCPYARGELLPRVAHPA